MDRSSSAGSRKQEVTRDPIGECPEGFGKEPPPEEFEGAASGFIRRGKYLCWI